MIETEEIMFKTCACFGLDSNIWIMTEFTLIYIASEKKLSIYSRLSKALSLTPETFETKDVFQCNGVHIIEVPRHETFTRT